MGAQFHCALKHALIPQMTGRKGRVVSNDDGRISYESRSELDVPVEILNITEKQRFMDGDKVPISIVLGEDSQLPYLLGILLRILSSYEPPQTPHRHPQQPPQAKS